MVKFYIILILGLISSKTVPTHIIEAENFNTEETLSFDISSGYEEYASQVWLLKVQEWMLRLNFQKYLI